MIYTRSTTASNAHICDGVPYGYCGAIQELIVQSARLQISCKGRAIFAYSRE